MNKTRPRRSLLADFLLRPVSVCAAVLSAASCSVYALDDAAPSADAAAPDDRGGVAGEDAGGSGAGGTSGGAGGSSGGAGSTSDAGSTPVQTVGGGTFDTNLDAAFDGVVSQTAEQSARTPIYRNLTAPPRLFREFGCEYVATRVAVVPPNDSHLLADATNYPNGGAGTVSLVGRRARTPVTGGWQQLATAQFGPGTEPVVFADLAHIASDYVAYAVEFASAQEPLGTLHVAEMQVEGYCAAPPANIAWSTTDWACSGVECVAESNPGGTLRRSVTCARDTGGTASEALCAGEKPADVAESCSLECAYHLVYIGAREFTYANDSGWLHEGSMTSRAGPLPQEVEHGATREAIEGKPCSIRTEDPNTYFVGISCREAAGQYCAFRCE